MNKDKVIETALALAAIIEDDEIREILLGEAYDENEIEDFLDIVDSGIL